MKNKGLRPEDVISRLRVKQATNKFGSFNVVIFDAVDKVPEPTPVTPPPVVNEPPHSIIHPPQPQGSAILRLLIRRIRGHKQRSAGQSFLDPAPFTRWYMISRVHLSNIVTIFKSENPGLDSSSLRTRFTFENPKFYELVRLGFSTYATPQTISLINETSETYELPRGVISELFKTSPNLTVKDNTVANPVKFSPSNIILKSFQKEPVKSYL